MGDEERLYRSTTRKVRPNRKRYQSLLKRGIYPVALLASIGAFFGGAFVLHHVGITVAFGLILFMLLHPRVRRG